MTTNARMTLRAIARYGLWDGDKQARGLLREPLASDQYWFLDSVTKAVRQSRAQVLAQGAYATADRASDAYDTACYKAALSVWRARYAA